jgi:hypothetical protein
VHTLAVPFNVGDYSISGSQTLTGTPGAQVKTDLKLTSNYSYAGNINAACDASALSGALCTVSPSNPISLASGGTTNLTLAVSIPNSAKPGAFAIKINTQDASGTPSHSTTVNLALAQDFTLTSSTPSQTVTAGQTSGPYALTVQPVGSSFTAAVTLACASGLPAGAQCTFNPSGPITPGKSAVDVVMSISTGKSSKSASSRNQHPFLSTMLFLFPGIVLGGGAFGKRRSKIALRGFLLGGFGVLLLSMLACAGASTAGGGGGTPPSNPVTYQITVTGTSPGTAPDAGQSAVVALVVD